MYEYIQRELDNQLSPNPYLNLPADFRTFRLIVLLFQNYIQGNYAYGDADSG